MPFDLTRGELTLVALISALIYLAGFLPRIATRLAGSPDEDGAEREGPSG